MVHRFSQATVLRIDSYQQSVLLLVACTLSDYILA